MAGAFLRDRCIVLVCFNIFIVTLSRHATSPSLQLTGLLAKQCAGDKLHTCPLSPLSHPFFNSSLATSTTSSGLLPCLRSGFVVLQSIDLIYLFEHSMWQDCDVDTCVDFECHSTVMDVNVNHPRITIYRDAVEENNNLLLLFNFMHRFWRPANTTIMPLSATCMTFSSICRTISLLDVMENCHICDTVTVKIFLCCSGHCVAYLHVEVCFCQGCCS